MAERGWKCIVLAILASTIAVLVVALATVIACSCGSSKITTKMVVELPDAEALRRFCAAGPALVLFHAPWCKYCTRMIPHFEAAAREAGDAPPVRFAQINAHKEPALVEELGLPGFPALALFSGGAATATRAGYLDSGGIQGWLRQRSGGGGR